MARILMAFSLISLIMSCAQKDAGNGLVKLSGLNLSGDYHRHTEDMSEFDSTFYVGHVDYFPDTREFYTAVFYRQGFEHPDEDLLESKFDSVIVMEEDWGRERLPLEEAKRMLVLEGLDTLSVFNAKYEQVCRCPLARVEYLWDGMESYFIAVYRASPLFPHPVEPLYGITSRFPINRLEAFSSEELDDAMFDEFLIRKLGMSPARVWEMRHYKVTPPEAMYSIISSFAADTDEGQSFLTYFEKNKVQILDEEQGDYQYLDILPVPIHMNGKPLLLVSAGYPSSDIFWDYLAGFDGTRYEAIDYNRIHYEDISPSRQIVLSKAAIR